MPAEAVANVVSVPEGRARRIPSVLRCGFTIFVVKLMLQIRGFGWTIRWIRRRLETMPEANPKDTQCVEAVQRAVAMAAALYPGRALCLEQSLSLYYLLRRLRIGAKFRLGAQSHPLSAHAWVEYDGQPINDFQEHVNHFVRLPEIFE